MMSDEWKVGHRLLLPIATGSDLGKLVPVDRRFHAKAQRKGEDAKMWSHSFATGYNSSFIIHHSAIDLVEIVGQSAYISGIRFKSLRPSADKMDGHSGDPSDE
jgi:hypothetical protein